MGYNLKTWLRRLASRSDLSSRAVHLTRGAIVDGEKVSALDILKKILTDKNIHGSSTNSGFICGTKKAVCFQDAPLSSLCQNVFYEQNYREINPNAKIRYNAIGIMFQKPYLYENGGRPVIYEKTEKAKEILPPDEWWRIVDFDLSNNENFIDWTHEREWRIPGDFSFDYSKASILFPNKGLYRNFVKWCKDQDNNILNEIKGISMLSDLLY
nr:hypothetical protein [uncultured Desulfuromonas sp.]